MLQIYEIDWSCRKYLVLWLLIDLKLSFIARGFCTGFSRSKNKMADWTRLELATPGVTGRYSNQLNYQSALECVYSPSA